MLPRWGQRIRAGADSIGWYKEEPVSECEKLERGRVCIEDASGISRGEFLKLGVAGLIGSLSLSFAAAGCAGAGDGEGTDSGEEDDGGGGYYSVVQ